MATGDQVKALVRSHAAADDDRFYSVAMQVAAHAARQGHEKLAKELQALVDAAKAARNAAALAPRLRPVPIAQPRGELAGLLAVSYPGVRQGDMAVDDATRERLDHVLLEQRQRGRLREKGFVPQRKLLFIGPPGTGKTMTAAMLASELGLPLFTIQFDGLISKFMGETAAKLRLIFDAIAQNRAVYLFDEFDALGGERSAKNDVGEIRRALNSFLQFLEQDDSDSLVIAATNHPKLLDRALYRRFDAIIEYGVPSEDVAKRVMEGRLATMGAKHLDWTAVTQDAKGLSHADLAHACQDAAKRAILANRPNVETTELVEALRERKAAVAAITS